MPRPTAPALDQPWHRPGRFRYALGRLREIAKPPVTVTEAPDDIVIDRDAEVVTRDGTVLRVNVFRTADEGPRPVIVSAHPYGKDNLPARRGKRWTYSVQYHILRQPAPVSFSALTGWEAPDPVWWVQQGFTVVNADLRGCGHSDGVAKLLSQQEHQDVYDIVQWAAGQPWSDGRVVMLGVSYLAISQYGTAALAPPALRAICPWEGLTDAYQDWAYPGGVREQGFVRIWSLMLRRAVRLAYDLLGMGRVHPTRDDFWRSLVPDLAAIQVPMLVCGSFSDHNLHSRGSIRAFTNAGSTYARLYTHRGGKWATFYAEPARTEQLAFLRAALDGRPGTRSVRLEVREDRDTVTAVREEAEWPLARTRWRRLCLAGPGVLSAEPPSEPGVVAFNTRSRAAAFTWAVRDDIELTGPMAVRLWLDLHSCDDANLFVGVEKWRDGRYVPFEGSFGYGRDRVTTGWQRVALRTLDPALSQPWQPVPACTDPQPLRAGEVVAVDVALGPVFDAVSRRRTTEAGGRRPLAEPAQPADRPITGRIPALSSRSRHPALGADPRRAPADPGDRLIEQLPTRRERTV